MFGINDDTAKVIGGGLGALIAGLFGRSFFKRRWSRDRVEGAVDAGEVDILANVQRERREWHEREAALIARVDDANAARYTAIAEAAQLKAEATVLKRRIETSTTELERLHAEILQLQARIGIADAEVARLAAEIEVLKRRLESVLKEEGGGDGTATTA